MLRARQVGSYGKDRHGHSSRDGRRGHRDHSHGPDGSLSSEDPSKAATVPEITVVNDKRQAIPSVVSAAFYGDLLSRLTSTEPNSYHLTFHTPEYLR